MHSLALVRLWRDVLNRKLDAPLLLAHSTRDTLCGIKVTIILHLAIKYNIRLPTAIDETAAWAVPSSCGRWRMQPGARPRELCPSDRCPCCDAARHAA
eukprot:3243253-Prymnesium_polylepis.2